MNTVIRPTEMIHNNESSRRPTDQSDCRSDRTAEEWQAACSLLLPWFPAHSSQCIACGSLHVKVKGREVLRARPSN